MFNKKEHNKKSLVINIRRFSIKLLIIFFIILLIIRFTYDFLSVTSPPYDGWLTIEGWIDDISLNQAVKIYHQGEYQGIICTGVPLEIGSFLSEYKTYPEMTAARLCKLGIPEHLIRVAIAPYTQKDRTYRSAIALKNLLNEKIIVTQNIHLISVGPHARRSHFLFKKALGPNIEVGVTSLPDPNYPSEKWYAYSSGVRSVISELIAYLYVLITPQS